MPEYRRRDRKGGKLTGGSGRTEETLDDFSPLSYLAE